MASKKNKSNKKIEDIEKALNIANIEENSKNIETTNSNKKEISKKEDIKENDEKTSKSKKKKESNTKNIDIKTSNTSEEKQDVNEQKRKIKNDKKEIKVKEEVEEQKPSTEEIKSANKKKMEEEQKALIKEMEHRQKKKTYITLNVFLIIIIILLFSCSFALVNLRSTDFVKGISIKNIDISNLSLEEAKTKITEAINIELLPEIKLKYNEYENTIKPSNIEYAYEIEDVLEKAYNVGRNGNIVINNYELLFTAFLGKNFDLESKYNEEILNASLDSIAATIPGVVVNPSYYIENNELIINKGKAGIKVKKEELKNSILDAIKSRNASEIILENKIVETIEIPVEYSEPDPINMDKIYEEIYKDPQDAYLIKEPFQIVSESDGIDLQVSLEEAKNVILGENKEEYRFALKITKPQKTIKDLGAEAFPYTISKFSTRYDITNRNRTENLEISANKINGTVLMPGESFSFNKVVGKRTIEEGYKNAKIYQNGEVIDGLAGGICQVSSTLYNAVLMANLQIDERFNHSFKTSYLAAGKDATVVYGVKDFKFTNTRSYPVKIDVTVQSGIIEFIINGIKEENEYEVKILPVITQTIPYPTEEILDPTLAPGSRVVVQKGSSGCRVTTYKEVRLNGSVVSKEIISNDRYNALKSIVRKGP